MEVAHKIDKPAHSIGYSVGCDTVLNLVASVQYFVWRNQARVSYLLFI